MCRFLLDKDIGVSFEGQLVEMTKKHQIVLSTMGMKCMEKYCNKLLEHTL